MTYRRVSRVLWCAASVALFFTFLGIVYAFNAPRVEAVDLPTTLRISICGDGIVQQGEVCDNGARNNVIGYSSSIAGRTCSADCQTVGPYCGDGILQVRFGEQCDDGNNTSGDLCSSSCQTEAPAQPSNPGSPTVGSIPQNPAANPGSIPSETATKVILRGKAYPSADVSILLDGKQLSTVRADVNADFQYSTTDITPGTASFSFLAKDIKGIDTIPTTVVFDVTQGAVTTVANIFLPPTISLSSKQVTPGELLTVFGQSAPQAKVVSEIFAADKTTLNSNSDAAGNWALQLDTGSLTPGFHTIKAYFQLSETIKSGFGRSINFYIGAGSIPGEVSIDLNGDKKVNLVDFSIFLTSWGTADSRADFNKDGKVNLADFSILLFNWTG